jgi:surfeit locus 1 family protein
MKKLMLNKKTIFTSILVILAVAVMVRLGIWQLDRLESRKAFNQHYIEQTNASPIVLDYETNYANLTGFEYRAVIASGVFDHIHEMAIRNQSWENQAGVHLLTPLLLKDNGHAVLVDRGWIPLDAYFSGDWSSFEKNGNVEISGTIRASQTRSLIGNQSEPQSHKQDPIQAVDFINIQLISAQIPYPLLPVYIQESPSQDPLELPYPQKQEIEVSTGSHLSYAIQWFVFSAILGIGYPIFLRREMNNQAID